MQNDKAKIQNWKLTGNGASVALVAESKRVKVMCEPQSEFPFTLILNGIFVSVLFPGQSKSFASCRGDIVEFRAGASAKPSQQTKGYIQ